ncbi:NAD(P)-dependent oxidoreductase [bacterium D16-76]|nr:NAD(P)-dependent oxidoreductase [bacterium D16-76]
MHITEIERREILRYMEMFDFRENLQDKTFLITGAGGLIGTGIMKWILLENELHGCNAHIIASTRNPGENSQYITYCTFGEEEDAVAGYKLDYLIHAASPTTGNFHKDYPLDTFHVNVDGMEKMLSLAARERTSVLYMSSEEVYGLPKTELPVKEDDIGAIDSLKLRSCYPLAKKVCEFLCYVAAEKSCIDAKIIRLSTTQGLFQKRTWGNVSNEILNCMVDGIDLHMKSDGMTKKCVLYSLDAIAAIFTVLFKGKKGHAYNATNPDTFMTIKAMANTLFAKFAPERKIIFDQAVDTAAMGFLPRRKLQQDISKIRQLGWEPKTSLEEIYQIDIDRLKSFHSA